MVKVGGGDPLQDQYSSRCLYSCWFPWGQGAGHTSDGTCCPDSKNPANKNDLQARKFGGNIYSCRNSNELGTAGRTYGGPLLFTQMHVSVVKLEKSSDVSGEPKGMFSGLVQPSLQPLQKAREKEQSPSRS
jgi:hypothetical protein